MKLTKENVCVFIEDEAQLEQARELLVKYEQEFYRQWSKASYRRWLVFDVVDSDWYLSSSQQITNIKNPITLTELEKILSDGKETE